MIEQVYDGGVLEGLVAELNELCGADLSALADGEAIKLLHRCQARLDAVVTRAAAAFETGGEWAEEGGRSATAWITARCRVPEGVARKELRLGRGLRQLPATESAWLAGDICESHVTAMVSARTEATEEAMDRDEAMLVDQATTLTYRHFVRALDYWHQHADPDGSEDDAVAQKARRAFRLAQSFDGMWFGDLRLDPISGAIVANRLRRIEKELFDADWAEAKGRFGNLAFDVSDLVRTPAQRRADALVEMAEPSRARRFTVGHGRRWLSGCPRPAGRGVPALHGRQADGPHRTGGAGPAGRRRPGGVPKEAVPYPRRGLIVAAEASRRAGALSSASMGTG